MFFALNAAVDLKVNLKVTVAGTVEEFRDIPIHAVPAAYVAQQAMSLHPNASITSAQISNLSAATVGTANYANTAGSTVDATNFTGSLAGDVSGSQSAVSVDKIKGTSVDLTGLADGQVLVYNASGTKFIPSTISTGGASLTAGSGISISGNTINAVTGGSTGLVALQGGKIPSSFLDSTSFATGAINGSSIANSTIAEQKISGVSASVLVGNLAYSQIQGVTADIQTQIQNILSGKANTSRRQWQNQFHRRLHERRVQRRLRR